MSQSTQPTLFVRAISILSFAAFVVGFTVCSISLIGFVLLIFTDHTPLIKNFGDIAVIGAATLGAGVFHLGWTIHVCPDDSNASESDRRHIQAK